MMQYHVRERDEGGGYEVRSTVDGRVVTRIGWRPRLPAAQKLAEATARRRLTWVKLRDGGYTSA